MNRDLSPKLTSQFGACNQSIFTSKPINLRTIICEVGTRHELLTWNAKWWLFHFATSRLLPSILHRDLPLL